MPFFKYDENGDILEAQNYVKNGDYELFASNPGAHTYPVDGWYWFNTRKEAIDLFMSDEFQNPPPPPEE